MRRPPLGNSTANTLQKLAVGSSGLMHDRVMRGTPIGRQDESQRYMQRDVECTGNVTYSIWREVLVDEILSPDFTFSEMIECQMNHLVGITPNP